MFIDVNGITLYYETEGQGRPVVLLHGNSEDHTAMRGVSSLMKDRYAVYCLDSRGHGQSSPADRLSYGDMADDVARFIQALRLEQPILIGASDGAIIGLLLAIRYPDLAGGLIAAGANRHPKELRGWFRALLRLGALGKKPDPRLTLMREEPNLTGDMLAQIRIPVLVLAGQWDILAQKHTRGLAEAIPGAALRILPGETHSSYIKHAQRLLDASGDFLKSLETREEDVGNE